MRGSWRLLAAAVAVVTALPASATPPRGRLIPVTLDLRMPVGTQRVVDYTLELPADRPGPVDLYVLVDTSGSMSPFLPEVRRQLAETVRRLQGRDVLVGVGELRTTSASDWSEGLTFRTLRRVGAIDAQLAGAIGRLGEDQSTSLLIGHGTDDEAHTVALDQAALGDGYLPYVPEGQEAGFTRAARRVVAVVTDEAFASDMTQPGIDEAVASLRSVGASVIGLGLDPYAVHDLAAVAAGTGSVSPVTVDCGAGRVAAGKPTACHTAPRAVGTTLERLLLPPRRGTVTVAADGARAVAPRSWAVDVTRPSRSRVRVTVACGPDAGAYDVPVRARLDGTVVAAAVLRVVCERGR